MTRARREVLRVAIPAIGEAYLQNLVGIVDALFISHLGLLAINAVGITNVYTMTYIAVFTAIGSTASIFISRGKGAKSELQIWEGFLNGLILATVLGILLAVASVTFKSKLLQLMGAQPDIFGMAIPYYVIILGSLPLMAWFTQVGSSFRALGDTKTPLTVGFEMNAVHVLLDYFLIFGIHGVWNGWGVTGAAFATVLARVYGIIRLLMKLRQSGQIIYHPEYRFKGTTLWAMTKLAIPAAGERLFMRLGQVVYFGMIVRMGVEVYAAHNIAGSITTFAYTIGTGFQVAATALIGKAIGAGDLEMVSEYRKWSFRYSAISMGGATLILFLITPWLGYAFTTSHDVVKLLTIVIGIDILSQPFLASVLVNTSAIQVGGNTFVPMVVTAVGMWGVRTLGVYLFGVLLGFGLPAVWASILADNMFRACVFHLYGKKARKSRSEH